MRHGNLASPTVRSLVDTIPSSADHAPDGLDETDIDALIDDAYAEVADLPIRPAWMSTSPVDLRAARRKSRQIVRTLGPTCSVPDDFDFRGDAA